MPLGRPRYLNEAGYRHDTDAGIGVLLANLGSPAAPTAAALRPYLRQFLADTRVIELPRWQWLSILNLIVVPFRSPKSARAYAEIWTDEGSPLIVNSRRQLDGIASRYAGQPVHFALGMSYGQPSIASGLRELHAKRCRHILVLPLYPQYAASTVGAVFDAVAAELRTWRWVPELRFVSGYCQDQAYIDVLAASISAHQEQNGRPDLTLFSFHGTQLAALESGDPYHCHCHRTASRTAQRIGWADGDWAVAFQSRFGNDEWLQPYTIDQMRRLPGRGVKHLHVVCPAFSADCLETLEEIAGENQEAFKAAGGESFSYIPALNDSPAHIDYLAGLVQKQIDDWLELPAFADQPAAGRRRQGRYEEVLPATTGRSRD